MYLHKTKNGHCTPPCCYFSGELEVVECLPQTFSGGMMVYRTILRMTDDRITQPEKTLAFFKQSIFYYREFVEDATHKYKINENMIQKEIVTWMP